MSCLVYPRPLESPLPEPAPALAAGSHAGPGGEEDFAGFRPRQPADSLRHVAWKAAARHPGRRPLLVKQFSGGAESELWLDWDRLPPAIDAETRLSLLAGWILAAEAAGLAWGLRLPGIDIAPAAGSGHRRRCLEALALFPLP